MSNADLYELLLLAEESLDRLFALWITGSFAVVVACYFGADRLNKPLILFIDLVYLGFSLGRYTFPGIPLKKRISAPNIDRHFNAVGG